MLPVSKGLVNRGENGRQGIVVYPSESLHLAALGPHFEDAPQPGKLAAQAGASRFAPPGAQRVAGNV
jgi:hypothetical protein